MVRLGVVTASEVDALISPFWKQREGEGPQTYMYRKLCEKMLGWAPEGGSWAMEQGSIVEGIAIPWYQFQYDVEVKRVGFITSDDGRIGCSPDGLIGDDCGIEIKSPQPPTHLKYLLKGEVPPEYRAQVHFSMLVTGRPRWVFLSYSRHFDPLVIIVERDPKVIALMQKAVDGFKLRFDTALAKLQAARDAENERGAAADNGR